MVVKAGEELVKWDQDMTNESGSTINAPGDSALELGSENDTAFRRGRKYRQKGYSLQASVNSVKRKNKMFEKAFIRGWKWQDRFERF